MDWKKHLDKFFERVVAEALGASGAAVMYHFISQKKDKDTNEPIKDSEGNPVMTLDTDKVRAHAPYFVMGLSDEAEFNDRLTELESGIQKNLAYQMGPVLLGPALPGRVMPGLGDHERADVILTTVQLKREASLKLLRELGSIEDPGEWQRRAVAFQLKKEKESDYLGSQLSGQVRQALISLVQASQTGLTNLNASIDRTERALARLDRRDQRRRQAAQAALARQNWFRRTITWPFRTLRDGLNINPF